jgi:predicted RNA binding protein YcfA (HicA-like mRNA interferase family)
MKYRDVARRPAALGGTALPRRSGGSHRKRSNPASGRATVIPDRGPKDLKLGTARVSVRQLGLDWSVFDRA